jgi:flagella basal body P-ring formation protein FlgA
MWRIGLFVLAFACSLSAGCIGVSGGNLVASDLAKADPAFATLDPSLVFAYAPAPGSQRLVDASELEKWASEHGLQHLKTASACFERTAQELEPADVTAAIRNTLGEGLGRLRIDVVEICPCKVPKGKLDFTLAGASIPPVTHPEAAVLWRGQLIDPDGRSYPVWTRVRVVASVAVVRATRNLHQQHTLTAEDLEIARIDTSPLDFSTAAGIQAYAGKVMKTSLAKGAILQPQFVRAAYEVERGSLVAVDVVNGGARLALSARAEAAGDTGEIITLTNPAGAARFQALVTGPGRAEVVLSSPQSDRPASSSEHAALEPHTVAARSF